MFCDLFAGQNKRQWYKMEDFDIKLEVLQKHDYSIWNVNTANQLGFGESTLKNKNYFS